MSHTLRDPLMPCVDSVQHTLTALDVDREEDWMKGVSDALARMERALAEHVEFSEAPNGLLAAIQKPTPSIRPTIDRRMSNLCEEHRTLHEQVRALHEQVDHALEAARMCGQGRSWVHFLRRPPDAAGRLAPAAVRESGARLLQSLRKHQESETKLVQETVNTDIGVGD